ERDISDHAPRHRILQQRFQLLAQISIASLKRIKNAVACHAARVPEAGNSRFTLPGKRKNAAGLKLVYSAINGMRRRDVVVAHECGYRTAVDFRVPARMSAERFQLRAEQE